MGRALVALLLMILSASAYKTSLDCPLRQIGLDYAATLQPFRSAAAFQEIADALNGAIEAANCSVKPKALGGAASAASTRVAWAPLPAAEAGVGRVFADPSKGNDNMCHIGEHQCGDGSERKPFRTIQRALKAVSAARARLGRDHGAAGQTTAPFAVILRAGTFFLGSTINLDSADSHVSFQAYPGEQVSVSGGTPIKDVQWKPFKPPPRAAYETKQGCLAVQFDAAPAGVYSAEKATSMCDAMETCAGFVINAKSKVVTFKTEIFWAPAGSSKEHGGTVDCTGDNIGTVHLKNFGYTASSKAAPNLYVADASGLSGDIEGLVVGGKRMIRARYPNARTVEQMDAMQVLADAWTPQPMAKTAEYTYNPPQPSRMDTIVDKKQNTEFFSTFKLGVRGPCARRFTPQASYWCSDNNEGGGPGPYSAPVGMSVSSANESLPHMEAWRGAFAGAEGAIVHSWRAGRWYSWAFEVSDYSYDAAAGKAQFDFSLERGGNQGSRGGDAGQEFMIENLLGELDSPGEFFHDKSAQKLYLWHNVSGRSAPPPTDGSVVAMQLPCLFNVTGSSQSDPVVNVSFTGITFRDTAASFMAPHGTPSGGDWAVSRTGAIFGETYFLDFLCTRAR